MGGGRLYATIRQHGPRLNTCLVSSFIKFIANNIRSGYPRQPLSASGIFITDNVATGLGTQVYWGSFAQARTLQNNDQLIVNVAGLSITLS